ncbi:MAG: phosphatase PAP2 family protein [Candidatus Heimdallarchaeota archaeon]|nr:phosphatase PAP2 family protein [Candidatus Heimdallarchaeota archaeon]
MQKKYIIAIIMGFLGVSLVTASLIVVYSHPTRDNPLDRIVHEYFETNSNEVVFEIMDGISNLGDAFVYVGILAILYYAWDKRKSYRSMVFVLTAAVTNDIAKNAFRLDRPYPEEANYGMPSGHAQSSTAFWGILATLIRKWWMIVISVLLALLISFSRIYMSSHWLTDVMVGLGISFILLAVYIAVKDPVEEHVKKQKDFIKLLYVFAVFIVFTIPIILFHYNQGEAAVESMFDALNFVAFFVSLSVAYIFEERIVNYDNVVDKKWKYVVRALFGLAVAGIFYGYTEIIDELGDEGAIAPVVTFVVNLIAYSLLGPFIILLAPWIIKKLKV